MICEYKKICRTYLVFRNNALNHELKEVTACDVDYH